MVELIGWKAIADYLQVAESTARKWQRERNLPVYKVVGQMRAKGEDLDKWRFRSPQFNRK